MKKRSRGAILVTGSARRIGRAVALALAADGFDIAIHYHASTRDALRTLADVRRLGVDADIFPCDLADPHAAAALVAGVKKRFPRLSGLVHSASLFQPSDISLAALPLLDRHMDIHVKAAWVLSAEFARLGKRGNIIYFLDTKVTKNRTDFNAYLLSKKALAGLVEMLAVRLAPSVRVNAVAPGLILPPDGKGKGYLQRMARTVPLRRPGRVMDVTRAVQFLMASDYVTGQTIFVDGGERL